MQYVIQEHDASTLHYDFRLEVDGVMKSWAVPKGPSTDPGTKRLAMPTPDHPLEYNAFEGVIPEGHYGAGTVVVWDAGTFENVTERDGRRVPAGEALAAGHLRFELHGEKLKGGWALTRWPKKRGETWLLVKTDDEAADRTGDPVRERPESVRTGRTLADVARGSAPRRGRGRSKKATGRVRAGRRMVEFSNPDKVLFPDDGITKAELVEYYARLAPTMVPHARGRPAMLHRYPDGIGRHGFYQKAVSDHFPDWVPRVEVAKKGGTVVHPCPNDAATLAYLAGQASITLHVWTSRADRLERPDQVIFDLDPSGTTFGVVVDSARRLRALLDDLGLAAYVKTTGSKGLHVVSPLVRRSGFDEVASFAAGIAELLARRHPDRLTTEFHIKDRAGRLYLDVARNRWAQTAVAPYAVRARPGAPVATPVDWSELDDPGFGPQRWTLRTVGERLAGGADPWAGMAARARALAEPRRRLDELLASPDL